MKDYVAINESKTTQQYVEVEINKTKEPEISTSPKKELYTREALRGYLKATFTKYGLEGQIPIAEAVIACESGFRVDPPHNNSCRGIAQFKKSTWDWFNKVRGTKTEFMNPHAQIEMMAWAWKQGYQNQWECYVKLAP